MTERISGNYVDMLNLTGKVSQPIFSLSNEISGKIVDLRIEDDGKIILVIEEGGI